MPKIQTMPGVISIAIFALLGATVVHGGELVRVDCQMESTYVTGGLFGDDSGTDPHSCGGEPFDYRDALDVDTACIPEDPSLDVVTSNVSGGGRWKLATVAGTATPRRAVGANFSQNLTGGPEGDSCTDLKNLKVGGEFLGGSYCSCTATCLVQARFAADRVFKKGATRQAFVVPVLQENPANGLLWQPRLLIDYVEPLYICTTADPDERFLQTSTCGTTDESAAEAELVDHSPGGPGNDVVIGRWIVPVQLRLIRVPTPGGGGGGGQCTLGQKNDPCSENADCCSNKCKGKLGAKTCK